MISIYEVFDMKLKIGSKVKGKITGIQPYGAFVDIGSHKQGLIHISECHQGFVKDIHDYLKVNQEVEALVLDIDEYTGKISLSLRDTDLDSENSEAAAKHKVYWTNRTYHTGFKPISERRPKWKTEALRSLNSRNWS